MRVLCHVHCGSATKTLGFSNFKQLLQPDTHQQTALNLKQRCIHAFGDHNLSSLEEWRLEYYYFFTPVDGGASERMTFALDDFDGVAETIEQALDHGCDGKMKLTLNLVPPSHLKTVEHNPKVEITPTSQDLETCGSDYDLPQSPTYRPTISRTFSQLLSCDSAHDFASYDDDPSPLQRPTIHFNSMATHYADCEPIRLTSENEISRCSRDADISDFAICRQSRNGPCSHCGHDKDSPNFALCSGCRKFERDRKRMHLQKMRAMGGCGHCGKTNDTPNFARCSRCRQYERNNKRKKRASQRMWSLRNLNTVS